MVSNTGTYIDCPFHRYAHGKDLSEIEIARFVDLEAIVVRIPHTLKKKLETPILNTWM